MQGRFPPQAVQSNSVRSQPDRQNSNWNKSREHDRPVRDDLRSDFLRDDERRVDRDFRNREYNRSRDSGKRNRDNSPKYRRDNSKDQRDSSSRDRRDGSPRERRDRSPHRSHYRHKEYESRHRRSHH